MPTVIGGKGLSPRDGKAAKIIATPPYDVIKSPDDDVTSELEGLLSSRPHSMYHVILGENPHHHLEKLVKRGLLVEDDNYLLVYEQKWNGQSRLSVLGAVEVSDPKEGKIRDHENTIEDQVKGRIVLAEKTGYTCGPVFCLALNSGLTQKLTKITQDNVPLFDFVPDFKGLSDLDGITNVIYRIEQGSKDGRAIQEVLKEAVFYIADGHHRYEAALGQIYFLAYITDNPQILAYNRLINGDKSFEEIIDDLQKKGLKITQVEKEQELRIPDKKGQCCVYTQKGAYIMEFQDIPKDVIGKLDVSLLQRDLFPLLGLDDSKIKNRKHFHYLPGSQLGLGETKRLVDLGEYSMLISMYPISIEEVTAVADERHRKLVENGVPDIGLRMAAKSTYFSRKPLTGLFLLENEYYKKAA